MSQGRRSLGNVKGAVKATEMEVSIEVLETSLDMTPSPIRNFHKHLRRTEPVYARLMELNEKGWKISKGDEHFQNQRQRADGANEEDSARFYPMMQQIGDEMQEATGAFCPNNKDEDAIGILDLCMAPGGYTATALKYNPTSKAIGITLPPDDGGHKVLLSSSRCTILYSDIMQFAKEYSVDKVLRTNARAEYREQTEANRLTSSQLILALQRIRHGGTLIMLLHRIEAMDTMELPHLFSQFSDVDVFKPVKKHAIRSTFYLIAKNVQPSADAARAVIDAWKKAWWNATFGGEEGVGAQRLKVDDSYMQGIIDTFADKFITLARPVWKTQADALRRSDFAR